MEKFPHLKFVQKVKGKPRLSGGSLPRLETEQNKADKPRHYSYLTGRTSDLNAMWQSKLDERPDDLPLLDRNVIPLFLQINPDIISNDFDLKAFGIEIISQEQDGFIIGASTDGLTSLNDKIKKFLNEEHGGGKIADFWQIIDGLQWKPEMILSEHLNNIWRHIDDAEVIKVEVGIAFDKPIGKRPDPTKKGGQKRLENYRLAEIERDVKLMARQDEFDDFISHYGERTSSFIDLEDSFSCSIEISGIGLKDLVNNYPFVFEVSEVEEIFVDNGEHVEDTMLEVEIIAPDDDSPEIAVIDSGIMEQHKYLSQAINPNNSKCYVNGEASTADYVGGGGHGTRVAGAVLFPNGVSVITQKYKLPCFVRNIRVLDQNNKLKDKFPAELMTEIINDNADCKVFNLSINSAVPYRLKHMSTWASTIDTLINKEDVLFIISTGNISKNNVSFFLRAGNLYPAFLNDPFCRIANPAQSCFALTVGSVNHTTFEDENWKSIGDENNVSAFSRSGCGIWGMIKPDVVEYGGGLITSKVGVGVVGINDLTAPELIRSTLHGGNAIGKDDVGTSYAAPKVTYIVSQLLRLYPEEGVNLLRALVVQGARLPNGFFENPTSQCIKQLGYGIPSLDRVTKNTAQRVTFYNSDHIELDEGHLYSLKMPDFLLSPAEEHDILIEVTLAYTSQVRRTRQKTKSYLATWLDWTTSRIGESFDKFRDYVLKEIDEDVTIYDKVERNQLQGWNWKIKNNIRGNVEGISRSNSTVQKDWTIIKSYELPKDFCFAVRAHKGWDDKHEPVPYSLVVSIEVLNSELEIYEAIRLENEVQIET